MKLRQRRSALIIVPLVAPVVALAACGGNSSSSAPSASSASSSSSAPAATASSPTGVGVKGAFGQKPTLEIPAKTAPTALSADVLTEGTGAVAAKGDLIVVNYLGQTWQPKDGKPNVFDNSFDKKEAFSFPLGGGQVIPGWDQGLEGKKAGSRVLLTIPPKLAYGEDKNGGNGLGGQTLVFVVDVVGTYGKDLASSGEAVTPTTAGLPKVTSEPGKKPTITSVAGVKVPAQPVSALLVKGDGDKIDPAKKLVLQLVITDTATGKQSQETWGKSVSAEAGQAVLGVATALKDANVGSRAVVVTPENKAQGQASSVLVVDVVGQF